MANCIPRYPAQKGALPRVRVPHICPRESCSASWVPDQGCNPSQKRAALALNVMQVPTAIPFSKNLGIWIHQGRLRVSSLGPDEPLSCGSQSLKPASVEPLGGHAMLAWQEPRPLGPRIVGKALERDPPGLGGHRTPLPGFCSTSNQTSPFLLPGAGAAVLYLATRGS